jgi:hypothetical protein
LIRWNIKRGDMHGLKNIRLGTQKVSLICDPSGNKYHLSINCERPFKLNIMLNNKEYDYKITNRDTFIELP